MYRAEQQSQNRKEVVEAIVLRNESVVTVTCVYNLSQRTIFDWLACYRNSGWQALVETSRKGCPVFVIADNRRYHHSKKEQAFLKRQSGEIMMAFLPVYSPELNPDEQV